MNAGTLLRAVRRSRTLSQRELAELAGVAPSTIDRIETGRSHDPGLGTIENILGVAGYGFVIVDQHGRLLDLDDVHSRLRDRGARRFPSHLDLHPIRSEADYWWGWRRIAWWPSDPTVPKVGFYRRGPSWWDDPYYANRRWDDAT